MITYRKFPTNNNLKVYLNGTRVGSIRMVSGGYRYFPVHQESSGLVYPTIEECKASLEVV